MSTVRTSPSFADRFERLWSGLRTARLVAAVAGLIAMLAIGLSVLAALDYAWELDWSQRALGLAIVASLPPIVCVVVVRMLAGWDRGRTAAELERRHPELGQSVRTTVEFRSRTPEQLRSMGILPSLVKALDAETSDRTESVPFDELVPRGWTRTLLVVALIAVAGVIVPRRFDWQWRTAVDRALLAETPYTTIDATASTDRVEAEENVGFTIDVHGRTPDEVLFQWRHAGEANWRETFFTAVDATRTEGTTRTFEVDVTAVDEPIEYRAMAGSAESGLGRVDVHYPIKVESVAIHVTPPEYTGLESETVPAGNVNLVRGSRLRFEVELDQPPATAELVVTGTRAGPKEETRLPFAVDGAKLSLDLEPTEDVFYRVVATAVDGTSLDEPRHRIRVRVDQPPRIWFEEPYDVIEVHALAEVLMRIRVQDDFGVARAGIVFEVNNEEEYELLGAEFEEAINELVEASGSTRRTAAVLERVLPLEHFELTQKDSVAYYAYVEDNFPDSPHRVETDLRFVDVRPFRRRFRRREDSDGNGGGGGGVRIPSLDEIITRQRVGLNRTIRTGKRADSGEEIGLDAVERMISFQNEMATETRRLAEFLQAREIEGNDSLFQAEERMLVAVDSIAVGNFETSSLQQKDALRYLIDARDKLEVTLGGQNRVVFTELMRFARARAQAMRRRDRDGEGEREAQRLIDRLRDLADTERDVATDLAEIVATATQPTEDDPADPGDDPASDGPSLEEVVERQIDAGLEARDLERILSTLDGITDLVRQRIGSAAEMAEGVSGSIDQGKTDEAITGAERAAEAFDELARNVEGLLARESADKVAVAASIAREIADRQRAIAAGEPEDEPADDPAETGTDAEMPDDEMPGERMDDEAEVLATFAAELERAAESGRTLLDVLEAIPENATREDDVAAGRVQELLDGEEPRESIERIQALPGRLLDEEPEDVREEAGAIAREMEATAERLETIRQRIVEPRVRELMDLEERAAELERDLEDLETQEAITGWHREADELLEDLEAAGLAREAAEELEDAMRGEGWERERPNGWEWDQDPDKSYAAPETYREGVKSVETSLQQRIRELILRERSSDADERTPPVYRPLVNRYFKVLTRGLDEEDAE